MSYKRKELLTLLEQLGLHPVFDGVCVAHLFSFLCYVVFLCFVCLHPVSYVPVSLDCSSLIYSLVLSDV